MDGGSGEITTLVSLTYNPDTGALSPDNTHRLVVVARDRGDPPMSSEVPVTIHVKPANQQPPVFVEDSYRSAVAENTPIGTSVLTVMAT